ncbi:SPOR domain-containing protein [Caproiciproducens sp. MSJ-32]|uniref:SPOR domain-containing protein n=1 Tax=Caproiciproducens sp. MSJ-32 TaxID=2841527 RepID=UPI001C0F7B77|nr:SPOR domain-containing protein [Caproiciproducens sp. MSJ-32]MBU5455918.1 SPOR domain-containing protein [Caproiciproducens sp. MSJ-32]
MKYTKYNYKKKNEGIKFFSSILITTVIAITIGAAGAWVIMKFLPEPFDLDTEPIVNTSNDTEVSESSNIKSFYLIQCGYFSKEENANLILSKIKSDFNAFIVKDEAEKFKVIGAITGEKQSSEVISMLNGKNIENAKFKVTLDEGNIDENQLAAIIEGHLEILNTAYKTEVKEVATNDFKEWINTLEEVKEGKYLELLKEYKEHIKNMPEKINKENMSEENVYLYNVLSKIKK